ncbi:MAG: hypothetical protein V4484_12230 [Pseudomonadota bacterium]
MTQQINLFNPIFRKQKKYFSSATMLQALGVICLACALLAADAMRRQRAVQSQAAAVDALLLVRQQKLADYKVSYAPRVKDPALATSIRAAESELLLLNNAAAMIERGGFGETRGFANYLRAFARQSIDGLWLTGLNISAGGAQLGVEGNAMQGELVPLYVRRLASEAVMRGKDFSSLKMEAASAPTGAAPAYLKFSLQSAGAAAPQPMAAK